MEARTLLVLLFIYFLPLIVAWTGKHPGRGGVFLVNLLLGWTFLGWVIALAWAIFGLQEGQAAPSDSGLADQKLPPRLFALAGHRAHQAELEALEEGQTLKAFEASEDPEGQKHVFLHHEGRVVGRLPADEIDTANQVLNGNVHTFTVEKLTGGPGKRIAIVRSVEPRSTT